MKRLLAIFVLFIACSAALTAHAQTPPPPVPLQRSITVTGEANEKIAPDQARLSLSVVTRDPSLPRAKEQNDTMLKKIVAIAQDFNIPKEKIATSGVNINPEYNYENNRQFLAGYAVSRSLEITIGDITQSEKLLSGLVEAKVDQIHGLSFSLAEPEAHAAPIRAKAYNNAKARAEVLAQAAGVKLGAPLIISTAGTSPGFPPPMPMMRAMATSDVMESSQAPSLPGLITLQESLTVTFALE